MYISSEKKRTGKRKKISKKKKRSMIPNMLDEMRWERNNMKRESLALHIHGWILCLLFCCQQQSMVLAVTKGLLIWTKRKKELRELHVSMLREKDCYWLQ